MNTEPPDRPRKFSAHSGYPAGWRRRLYKIIFEADTLAGKTFDVGLLIAILISVAVIMLESVPGIRADWEPELLTISGVITALFTVEYILRLICVRRPLRYVFSFFGIVDLLAILPAYLAMFIEGEGPEYLSIIRALRLLRVFHVFQLSPYVAETQILLAAIKATKAKIVVFLLVVVTAVLLLGTAIYVVENPHPGTQFTSIPRSVYWAVVTITTVGYGDIAPQTVPGQVLAAAAMILGYSMIIVPVAIFSVEFMQTRKQNVSGRACSSCLREGHDTDAVHCKYCGAKL